MLRFLLPLHLQALGWLERKHGIQVLLQPEDTVEDSVFTRDTYSLGSVKLDLARQHGPTDHFHMNAAFGTRIMQQLNETLASGAQV